MSSNLEGRSTDIRLNYSSNSYFTFGGTSELASIALFLQANKAYITSSCSISSKNLDIDNMLELLAIEEGVAPSQQGANTILFPFDDKGICVLLLIMHNTTILLLGPAE